MSENKEKESAEELEMTPGDDVAEAQRPLDEAVAGTSGEGNIAGDQKPVSIERE